MDDTGLDDNQEELDDEDRWLVVHPIGSRPAYRDMLNLIASRTDRDLRGRLEVAVDGPGAFRRFKNVLSDWPEDRDDWFAYSDERRRGRARAWSSGQGCQPAIQPKPQSPDDLRTFTICGRSGRSVGKERRHSDASADSPIRSGIEKRQGVVRPSVSSDGPASR